MSDAHVTIGDVGVVVAEYERAAPAPALRPFVAAYSGYRDAGGPPATHVGAPSPFLTFIVTLDEDLELLEGSRRRVFPTLLGGLHLAPVTVVHDGRQSGIQVSLHPLGIRALFGAPAAALGAGNHLASDVAPGWVDELHDRVRSAVGWPARFRAVDLVLQRALHATTVGGPVQQAWHAVSAGGWSVGALADRMGWEPRRLTREFDREFGVSPKVAARLGRFDRARQELVHGPTVPRLADLAARHGYYDQAHLAREFRQFAGAAPSVLLAAERRSVQAGPA